MNRRERRAQQKQQGRPFPMALPGDDPEMREMAGSLVTRLEKRWPKTDRGTTERKSLALFSVCASYLAHLPDNSNRRAILSEATELLTQLTLRNERNLKEVRTMEAVAGPLSEELFKAAGATVVEDDEPKSN